MGDSVGTYSVKMTCTTAACGVQIGGSDSNPVIESGVDAITLELDQESLDWLSAVPGRLWSADWAFEVIKIS